jgi:aminopeptidase N
MLRRTARTGPAMVGLLAAALLAAGACEGGRGGGAGRDPGAAGPSAADYHVGAAGVGDPYYPTYGNGGYDVRNYLVKVKYEPRTDVLAGDVTITARATENLSGFNLDLSGLTVRSVRVNDAQAPFERDRNELVLRPSQRLPAGSDFTVRVTYDGVPGAASPDLGEGGFRRTGDGAYAIGEPKSASTWFPVNDHPLDKATYAFEITVPNGLSAVSNGVPRGSAKTGGWTTWRWSESSPMASYLATVVIGNYRVTTGNHAGKPVVTAVAGSLPAGGDADRAMARTTEIADFLATRFGPYPFDAYGGVVVDDEALGFALETQSRPVYASRFFRPGGPDTTWVVAHELAHQWFGDSVSVHHWRDIWLNEGFASYAEWLWEEHARGRPVQASFEAEYKGTPDEVWSVAPADPGRANLFSRSVYRRGAMALHALRVTAGDDAFFRILRTWAAEKRNGNATTAEFITLAERVSGKPLRALFEAWLYATSKPPMPG